MSNTINKFTQYITLLDEVYKTASVTSVLDGAPELARQGANANELIIPKISMNGLADYGRSSGYVSGDVTFTNETVSCNYDRARKFTVDAVDDIDTAGMAFGRLSSEFIRTKVAPELDAFRFATYAGTSGISTVDGAALSTGAGAIAAIALAADGMTDKEVPAENRHLFITSTILGLIRDLDTTKSREIMSSFASTVVVPQSRFYTAIDLYDGTTDGETAGGYVKASGGKNINFMIIHKPAAIQFEKRNVNKIFTPDENQDADGWIFNFREVGIADVYDNKVDGIYLHKAAS
jgi:hypothetical protein